MKTKLIRCINGLIQAFIVIIIVSGMLYSCKPLKQKCAERFPPETITIIKDSIVYRDTVIIHDSIITVYLPNDTVRITKYLKVPKGTIINLDTIIVEQGIIGAMAFVKNNELGVIAYVADSSLFYQLDSARIEITKTKEFYHSKIDKSKVIQVENSKFAKFCIWVFWIVVAGLLGFIGGRFIYKKYFK